jgi:hypothetical protein
MATLKTYQTPIRLNTCSISICGLGIPRICLAMKPMFGK